MIDGSWYIREDLVENYKGLIEINPIEFEGVSIEFDDFSYEAVRTNGYKELTYIEFKDKTRDVVETWDNTNWMSGVARGEESSIRELRESGLSPIDIKGFISFLVYLKEHKKWLK